MKNYKKGFVCGFFDILHEGHINILSQAKDMCDYLIVGVGTDDFMIRRKNHESILSYEQRVSVVRAIQYVDEVVPEEDLDKVAAYKKYHFDVMFAGSDHENERIYIEAEKTLKEFGVDTIYISRINDTSSTKLRKRAVKVELLTNYLNEK